MPDELVLETTGIARVVRGGESQVVTTDSWRNSWMAKLVRPTRANTLHLRYFRKYENPVKLIGITRTFRPTDGVYEAESTGPGGEPRLFAFQIKGGSVIWIHNETHDKTNALRRIDKALAELG